METLDLKVLEYENDEYANINGTSFQGVIKTTYDQLVEIFGKPTFTDADPYEKVNAEWTINSTVVEKDQDPDDYFYKVFTIYNWKDGRIPTEEYEWHIGGQDYEAKEIADAIFENYINKSKGQDVMVTTTVATVITMIATMFAYYFGRFVGSRDKVDIIVDSMLKRLEKDGFIRTKKGKDGEVELIKINDLTNEF